MDKKTTIEYMKKAIACDKATWEKMCRWHETCANCRNHFPVPLINVVKSALELLETEELPPTDVVPTESQEIGYDQCANAMLKMWMDNVVTDGEYNRIMDRLNTLR